MSVQIRNRTLKSGAKSYYLDIHHNGERWREFLKIRILPKDPKRAELKRIIEEKRAQRELEILSDDIGRVPEHIKNKNFFDFAESFLKGYRKKDVRIVAASIKKFGEAIDNPRLRISQVTPSVMKTYMEYLIYDAGLSGETAHNYFTRFKKLLKEAKLKGYLKDMPTSDLTFKNPNKDDTLRKQVLTEDELQVLAGAHCGNPEVRRAFLFSCFTSLGLAEIKALKWGNIKNGRLETSRAKTGELINNRLSATALNLLGEKKTNDDYIFRLQKISTNGVNKAIRYWVGRAEIDKHITFYSGRHTFACLMLLNGANLKTTADAMGHSSTSSTLKYLNHVSKLQDEAIDNLPDIEL